MFRILSILTPIAASLFFSGSLPAQSPESAPANQRDQLFQSAVSFYESGHYAEAAVPLEKLAKEVPESFEVHELLGLVYAAEAQDMKANDHLSQAVRLKPDSVAARSNLAASYARIGKYDLAMEQFRKAVELDPQNYDTNHNLAEAYIHGNNIAKALPYLEKAQRINPAAYDNGYDLSLAFLMTGKLADARNSVQNLLKVKNTGELHNLLGQIEEKDGQFVAAENQFESAARMEPSESNLFDWASELLLHRTLDPAVKIFQEATARFPDSSRMMVGLGMAYYARGNYDDAVKAFLKAADLNPSDERSYKFLARAYDSSPGQAADVIERFRRFADLQPHNGQAIYYYAMSLWKGKRAQDPDLDLKQIESLLKNAIAESPKLPEAHLQIGNLSADQGKFAEAILEYQRALELDYDLADAHYRLGQAYVRTGQKDRAQGEFDVYQKLRAQHLADLDKQRAEIRQFVYSERDSASAPADSARP
jgi:tetratricopeptide (TPR) repeat protein